MRTIEVVAAAIRDAQGRIFATQRGYGEYKDWWELPGGKVEAGESREEALRREILEELDTEVSVDQYIATVEYDYPAFHLTMHCYWCSIVSGRLELKEHEAARWLSPERLGSVNWLPADLELLPHLIPYTDVFLDFDDTLYDTHGNACKALEIVFEHFGLGRWFARPEDFTVPYWEVNEQLWTQYAAGEIARPYLIVERFRRPLSLGRWIGGESGDSKIPQGTPFEPTEAFCHEVSDFFLDRCCEQNGVVPGAMELLEYLKSRGYRLHMTSNGFHEVQLRKLAAVGMTDYFDTVILSEDAGVNKPAKEFFDYAFRASGADPKSTILIGDNLVTDIDGARRAGLPQIWFNPKDKPAPDFPVTHIVRSLDEIREILGTSATSRIIHLA